VAASLATAGSVTLDGDASILDTYAGILDIFDPNFNIVTP
jgi:alkyl sulfatase BDS1-like metallo-beta-lactamase superfamily hydrolase